MRLLLNNNLEIDGFDPEEVFGLTLSAFKFNSVVNQGGSYSTILKVAKTVNNTKVLGFPDDPREKSFAPYQRYLAQLDDRGQVIFQGVAIAEESEDFYGIRLFSAIVDFFAEVGNKTLNQLDLSSLNHAWTAAEVFAGANTTSDYCYPPVNYGLWTGTKAARAHTDFFPAVYFKKLLETSATEQGWTLNNYDSDYGIPFSKKDFENTLSARAKYECSADFDQTPVFNQLDILEKNFDTVTSDPTGHKFEYEAGAGDSFGYRVRENGVYDFHAHLKINNGTTANRSTAIDLWLFRTSNNSGNIIFQSGVVINATDTVKDIEIDIYANGVEGIADRFIQVGMYGTVDGLGVLTIKAGSYIECTDAKEPILDGELIGIADTLPKMSIKDLFLFEAARTNSILFADGVNKTLEFIQIDTISAKSPIALDLTNKINLLVKPKYTYRLTELAQNNLMEWLEGTDDDPSYKANPELGNSSIAITDGGLELTKILYKAKFAASALRASFTDNIHLFIPRYIAGATYDDPTIDPKVRVAKIGSTTDYVVDITGQSALAEQRYLTFESWETLISANYTAFQSILDRMKIVEVEVHLSFEDINKIDFKTPVLILGAYWLIQEVKQYKVNSNESTPIKLIRI